MKKNIAVTVLCLVLALLVATPVYATALWQGIIRITNDGTAAAAVSVPLELDTDTYVSNGYTSDDFSDIAFYNNAGTSVPFMPGYGTNPCIFDVTSIDENKNIDYTMQSGNVDEGIIAYFPDTDGMTVPDNPALELDDEFRIALNDAYIDTSVAGVIGSKPGAFPITSDGVGNVTAGIPDGTYSIFDKNETLSDYIQPYGTTWYAQTFTPSENYSILAVEIPIYRIGSPGTVTVSIRDTAAGVPTGADLVSGTTNGNTLSTVAGSYRLVEFGSSQSLSAGTMYAIVVRATSGNSINWEISLANPYAGGTRCSSANSGSTWTTTAAQDFGFRTYDMATPNYIVSVSAAVADGHYDTIELVADGTDLNLNIDGVTVDTAALGGASVPDNANNWQFGSNATLYIGAVEIDVAGSPVAHWEWEYNTTFTDTISGIEATPSFRTTSSDADVSAELVSFGPYRQARADTFSIAGEIPVLATPTDVGWFEEGGGEEYIPGAEAVNELLDEGNIPHGLWWYPFLYFGICIIGLIIYGATQGGRRSSPGLDGSLLTMSLVMEVLLVVIGIVGIAPLWPAYLFWIPAMAIIISRKHYSWG